MTSPRWNIPFATGALMRGDDSDPKVIETNTSTEYWQKGASLLHTDPDGTRDVALPANVRGYYLPGTQHGGKAGMPRDAGPCTNPRNWHDPMPAIRALLVALDEWVTNGREPPPSRLPRIADGTLVRAENVAWPKLAPLVPPRAANDVVAAWRLDRSAAAARDLAGAGAAGGCGRQRDRRHPAAGHRRAARHLHRMEPVQGAAAGGELADRDGTYLAFAATRTRARTVGRSAPIDCRALSDAGGACRARQAGGQRTCAPTGCCSTTMPPRIERRIFTSLIWITGCTFV